MRIRQCGHDSSQITILLNGSLKVDPRLLFVEPDFYRHCTEVAVALVTSILPVIELLGAGSKKFHVGDAA